MRVDLDCIPLILLSMIAEFEVSSASYLRWLIDHTRDCDRVIDALIVGRSPHLKNRCTPNGIASCDETMFGRQSREFTFQVLLFVRGVYPHLKLRTYPLPTRPTTLHHYSSYCLQIPPSAFPLLPLTPRAFPATRHFDVGFPLRKS